MENDDGGKENWWKPETPSKSTSTRQQPTPMNSVSPVTAIHQVFEALNETVDGVGSPVKQFRHAYSSHGATEEAAIPPSQIEVELDLPSPTKKRKANEKDDTPSRKPKKKRYWPKIDTPLMRTNKPKSSPAPKPSTPTPKPSTPHQRKSDVRTKVPNCQRSLFAEDSIDVSLPFLKKLSDYEVEQGGFLKNEIGMTYNSLQSYSEMTSSSCICLFESRQSGVNFPIMCRKKRSRRERPRLEKFLGDGAIVKGKRSKTFIRKKRCNIVFNSANGSTLSRKMKSLIHRIHISKKRKSRQTNQVNPQEKSEKFGGEKSEKSGGELVMYKPSSLGVDIMLDEETLRVWDLLKDERGHREDDEMKDKYWRETRKIYHDMIASFITCMHMIQGDRRFLPWKGSVLDSVVGVYLTQNVSDSLSSSAYMSLAARFPIQDSCGESKEEPVAPHSQESIGSNMVLLDDEFDQEIKHGKGEEVKLAAPDSQESIGSNMVLLDPEFDKEIEHGKDEEVEDKKAKDFCEVANREIENGFIPRKPDSPAISFNKEQPTPTKKSINEALKREQLLEKQRHWDKLRKIHTKSYRHDDQMDSVDWEAVRCAQVHDVAQAIASRGQHNIIAGRIKSTLNILKESNGSVDLEWLRHVPPKDAKEYLLNLHGIGLKSVECLRLLTLQHCAFPVDVNVGRIAIRLGWVPIQPLPEPIQFHNLEQFPNLDKVQQYLWPRLCTLDQRTLYELHYQMITFGKVFCTKKNPNCNACPMKNECKHYASALASKKLALPEPTSDQGVLVTLTNPINSFQYSTLPANFGSTSMTEVNPPLIAKANKECEPIIEMPASPENHNIYEENVEDDIDDIEDIEDLQTINLSQQCWPQTHDYSCRELMHDANISTSLVVLSVDAANIPLPKVKNVGRLKTERLAYVLTDNHPLLTGHAPLEPNDPSPYLFVVWTTGELESSCESSQDGKDGMKEELNNQTVPGTLMIPCRSAMRGRFPLNGTYFQVNEVFADYDSMIHPINAPRAWLWKLKTQMVYFGSGASAIMRGMTVKEIHEVFWNGYICVRAMDSKTRASRPISSILLGKKD